jgi:aminopeptidase N
MQKSVEGVCKLRAGESAEVAATVKQVAARARQQRWRETEVLREGTRASKRTKAAADKLRASRLREELRVSDQAVLQWGAKRDFIRKMHNTAPRHTVVERVLSAVRVLLTRAQKKRKRRRARREGARASPRCWAQDWGGGAAVLAP